MEKYINSLNNLFNTKISCEGDNLEVCAKINNYKSNTTFNKEFIKKLEKHYKNQYGISQKINSIEDIKNIETSIYDNLMNKQELKLKNMQDQYQDIKNIQNQFRDYIKYSSDVKHIAAGLPTIAPSQPEPSHPQPSQLNQPSQPQPKSVKVSSQPKSVKVTPQPVKVTPQPVKVTPQSDSKKSDSIKFIPQPFVNKRESLEDILENKGKDLVDMYDMSQKSSRYIRDGKIDDFHKLDSSELDLTEKALIESVKMFDTNLETHLGFIRTNMEKYNKMSNINKYKISAIKNIIKNIEKEGDVMGKLLDSESVKKTCIECMDLFTKDENGTIINDFEKDYTPAIFNDPVKRREYFTKVNKRLQDMINAIQLKYYSTGNTAYINLVKKLQNCYEQLFNLTDFNTAHCPKYIKSPTQATVIVNPY
jgi:hypothetical protein